VRKKGMDTETDREKADAEAAKAKAAKKAEALAERELDFLDFTLGADAAEAETAKAIPAIPASPAASAGGGLLDGFAVEADFVARTAGRKFGDILSDPGDRERFRKLNAMMLAKTASLDSSRHRASEAEAEMSM